MLYHYGYILSWWMNHFYIWAHFGLTEMSWKNNVDEHFRRWHTSHNIFKQFVVLSLIHVRIKHLYLLYLNMQNITYINVFKNKFLCLSLFLNLLQERLFLTVSNYIFTAIFVGEMTLKVNIYIWSEMCWGICRKWLFWVMMQMVVLLL